MHDIYTLTCQCASDVTMFCTPIKSMRLLTGFQTRVCRLKYIYIYIFVFVEKRDCDFKCKIKQKIVILNGGNREILTVSVLTGDY